MKKRWTLRRFAARGMDSPALLKTISWLQCVSNVSYLYMAKCLRLMGILIIIIVSLKGQPFPPLINQNYSPPDCVINPTPCSILFTDTSLYFTTLRYSSTGLTYNFIVSSSLVIVTLYFEEPNKTGQGQRVFTVRINDELPDTIDVFRMSGGQKKVLSLSKILPIQNGQLKIVLRPLVGNVIISKIELNEKN